MIQNWKFQRGDIFFTRFDNAIGSEQSGNRPAVVLQNDVGNFYSPTLIVATLTSKAAKKYTQPTHCLLVNDFLSVPSIVQAEQIFTVDKSRVLKFLGHLTPEEMSRVDDAVRASLALNPMGSIQRLPPIIRSTAAYAPPEVVDGKPPLYPYTPIKSSFEDAGSVEDMMLYTELEAAVHAMIQRLEYSFTFNPSLLTIPKRKQQVAEILKEADVFCKDYMNKIKKDVEVEVVSIEKKALADRKLYEEKTVSGMEFLERNSILRAKQQVIEQAIDKARESIAGLNDEEYFNVLEKLLRKNVQQGKGKICFSKKDLDRIPNGFENRVKEIVAENQGELVIDKEPANIKDGFVLVYGEIEENCTLKALFDSNIDRIKDIANKQLFG